MSPVKKESTNTVIRYQHHDYGSIHCCTAKSPPLLIHYYNMFLLPFSPQSVIFLWSITNIFCFYCYCYSVSKGLGKSCNYLAHVFLIIPHSWQTFLIYHATSSSHLSQHITLGSHDQCNWHYHVS